MTTGYARDNLIILMARTPNHPSGAAKPITVSLSPEHRAKLDRLAAAQGRSRSNLLMRLLDRTPE